MKETANIAIENGPLIVSALLVRDVMQATPPCFAMGLAEEDGHRSAFFIMRPETPIPLEVAKQGMQFGHSAVVDAIEAPMFRFVFEFYDYAVYSGLVPVNDAVVQAVVPTMIENADYLFFTITPDNVATLFRASFTAADFIEMKTNWARFKNAKYPAERYERAVYKMCKNPDPSGSRFIKWVCRENPGYLNTSDYGMDFNSFLIDEPRPYAFDKAKDKHLAIASAQTKIGEKAMFPSGVSSELIVRPDGSITYNLTHKEVGQLGRIILEEAPPGSPPGMGSLLSYEIANVSDGHEKPRKAIMEEVAHAVSEMFARYAKGEIHIPKEAFANQQTDTDWDGRFSLDDMAALAALQAALDIERHIKRPWPLGITVEKTIDPEEHCLIYSYKHDKIGEVGRVVVLFRGDSFGVYPEICLDNDGHRSEREMLMTEIAGIMHESFESRPEIRKGRK
jgi:hypothetical protein